MKAGEIIDRIKKNLGAPWRDESEPESAKEQQRRIATPTRRAARRRR